MKETYILRDRFAQRISRKMMGKEVTYKKIMSDFFAVNSDALFAPSMKKRIVFSTSIEERLFDTVDITPEEVSEALEDTHLNKKEWFQRNRPVFFLALLIYRYLLGFPKKQKEQEMALMFIATVMYSGRQQKYFPHNTSVAFNSAMDYTANNISNKFLLKSAGSVYASIESIASTNSKTYRKGLENGSDKELLGWITNLYNRINQFVKIFSHEFYDNYNNKRYLNLQQSVDDMGELVSNENISTIIQKVAEKAYMKTRINSPDLKLVRLASASNGISQVMFKSTMESIYKHEDEDIRKTVTLILMIFLVDEKQSAEQIHSAVFLLKCLKAFTKSNTNEPSVLNLKKVMSEMLERNSASYNKTERENTKVSMRKAVFQYFAMLIQSA